MLYTLDFQRKYGSSKAMLKYKNGTDLPDFVLQRFCTGHIPNLMIDTVHTCVAKYLPQNIAVEEYHKNDATYFNYQSYTGVNSKFMAFSVEAIP